MRLDEHKELKSKQESTDTLEYIGEKHYEDSFHCASEHDDTDNSKVEFKRDAQTLMLH
jgi:hypothetical protein